MTAILKIIVNKGKNMEQNINFNSEEIVLTLSVMSDIHISGSWGIERSEHFFKNALNFANKAASNKIDAFLFTGDFTDSMNSKANVNGAGLSAEEFEAKKAAQNKTEFEILRRCFSEEIDKDAEIIYCLGNHDSINCNNTERFITEFSSRDTVGDNKNFDRMYRTDTDLEALHKGMRHCVYKGYHFLCIDMANDNTDSIAFLKRNLDEIIAKEPDKYVFILHHCKTPDMNYASNMWGTNYELHELLKNYPQAILFAGHKHCALHNERSIMQREYTSVEASCVSYIKIDCVKQPENVTHSMGYQCSQGLLVELDKSGNMRITRLDYAQHVKIKEPWILAHPNEDNSHLKTYTDERRTISEPPQFGENFGLQVSPTENGTLISFNQAKHDDMPYRYEIAITDYNGNRETFYLSSLFCYYPYLNDIPNSVWANIDYDYSKIYTLTVTPQDVWYNSGKSVTYYF